MLTPWDEFLCHQLPTTEEEHDFRRSNGRVVQDIARFDQVGRTRGTFCS